MHAVTTSAVMVAAARERGEFIQHFLQWLNSSHIVWHYEQFWRLKARHRLGLYDSLNTEPKQSAACKGAGKLQARQPLWRPDLLWTQDISVTGEVIDEDKEVVFTCAGHHKLSGQPEDAVVRVKLNNDGARWFIWRNHHLRHRKTNIGVSLKAELFCYKWEVDFKTSQSRDNLRCGTLCGANCSR